MFLLFIKQEENSGKTGSEAANLLKEFMDIVLGLTGLVVRRGDCKGDKVSRKINQSISLVQLSEWTMHSSSTGTLSVCSTSATSSN